MISETNAWYPFNMTIEEIASYYKVTEHENSFTWFDGMWHYVRRKDYACETYTDGRNRL